MPGKRKRTVPVRQEVAQHIADQIARQFERQQLESMLGLLPGSVRRLVREKLSKP